MARSRTQTRRKRRRLKPVVKKTLWFIFAAIIIISLFNILHRKSDKQEVKSHKPVHHETSKQQPPKKNPDKEPEKVGVPEVGEINEAPAIDNYLKSLNFNGSVLVVKNDKILMNKGYGYADMETKRLNDSKTVFYIGSISKVFVSTAIMQLQEQGKLNVKDPLSKYIADFPNANQITLYHLLTHTSGIPEHNESGPKISREGLIKKIAQGKLKFQPGADWFYSDSNYSILAYIIEKLTNEPLYTYIDQHIFKPAGLQHTGFGESFNLEPSPSKGYKLKDNQMISPSLPDMSQLFGCGDIYTTPYDMYLFDKALYNGKLISQQSLGKFFTPFKHNYAFGLYADPGSYSDHGVLPGWNCLNSFSKNGKIYVVLFSNIQNKLKSLGTVNNQIYISLRNIQ
jgi:CubicO group peptidase (beta-lactamase class C family)